jgi:hypothetical protein
VGVESGVCGIIGSIQIRCYLWRFPFPESHSRATETPFRSRIQCGDYAICLLSVRLRIVMAVPMRAATQLNRFHRNDCSRRGGDIGRPEDDGRVSTPSRPPAQGPSVRFYPLGPRASAGKRLGEERQALMHPVIDPRYGCRGTPSNDAGSRVRSAVARTCAHRRAG